MMKEYSYLFYTESAAKEEAAEKAENTADAITKKIGELSNSRVARQEKMTCKEFADESAKFSQIKLTGTAAEILAKVTPFLK